MRNRWTRTHIDYHLCITSEPTKDSDLRIVTCERIATCLRIVTSEFGSVSPCVLVYVTNAFSQIKSLVLLIFVTTIRSCNI